MIPVKAAAKPATFDSRVRDPGLSAIAELVGEAPTITRPGPKRPKIAERREDIPPGKFPPFWREATEDLLAAYGRICAYACLFIPRFTGSATVDHWAPKSRRWDTVYEWENYRLACSIINSRKNDYGDVIDPFEVTEELFELDLVKLKARPGPKAAGREAEVVATITRLGLDGSTYSEALGDYYHAYVESHVSLAHLERQAPFLARELRRQGKLLAGDA